MKDLTPRCPHCHNLTLIGSLAGKLVAVCTYCENGFALAADSLPDLLQIPAQCVTRIQLEKASKDAQSHLNKVSQEKQDDLVKREAALPKDRETWTPEQQQEAAQCQSQRMMYAGVLQGAASYRDLQARMLGLPQTTLTES